MKCFPEVNHSASGFVSAQKSHNRKDYDKQINPCLLLRYKGFGKIFFTSPLDRITALVYWWIFPEENEKISANDF